MTRLRILAVAAAALFAASCRGGEAETNIAQESAARQVAPILAEAKDASSYARPLEARVTHVDLDLDLDFAARRASPGPGSRPRIRPESGRAGAPG